MGDGWSSPEVRRFAADAVRGALFTDLFSPSSPRPEVEPFIAVFQQRYRATPGTFAALGYDAARWVLRAALRPAQLDAVALRDALLNQRLDDAVCAPLTSAPDGSCTARSLPAAPSATASCSRPPRSRDGPRRRLTGARLNA